MNGPPGLSLAELIDRAPPLTFQREALVRAVVAEELRAGRLTQHGDRFMLTRERFQAAEIAALRPLTSLWVNSSEMFSTRQQTKVFGALRRRRLASTFDLRGRPVCCAPFLGVRCNSVDVRNVLVPTAGSNRLGRLL